MPPQSQQNPQPQTPAPAVPASVAEHRSSSLLSILIALIILLALAAGAYFTYQSGLWQGFMPAVQQEVEEAPPPQTETSDLEAELNAVDVGSDAEIDSLEAQI